MIRIRNALSKLIRVDRSRARAPDSIPPFIRIVKDQPCPYCGSKFPNRPKVHDGEGWWWRCYTEDCVVGYYQPEHMLARRHRDFVLRYIIAHELAHLTVKRHTWRLFWKIVGIIYPEYEKGKEEVLRIAKEELMKRNKCLLEA